MLDNFHSRVPGASARFHKDCTEVTLLAIKVLEIGRYRYIMQISLGLRGTYFNITYTVMPNIVDSNTITESDILNPD